MKNERKPITCIVDPKRGLMYAKWQDEHESLIPLDIVRQNCPCIECRILYDNPDPLRLINQTEVSTMPVNVQELGNYALQIFWKDGHQTGLYGWTLLRSLCPCKICQP